MYIEGLDLLDNKILNVIKKDARLSYSDIGEKVGLSRVAVKNRIDNLEKKGIIRGYRTVINSSKVPDSVRFFLDVETYPENYSDVITLLCAEKRIKQVHSVSGDCRIRAVGDVPNSRFLETFVNNLYNNTKGIRRVGLHVMLATFKDVDGGVDYERKDDELRDSI